MTYDPQRDGERRQRSCFERDVIAFMARVDEHMKYQSTKCAASHLEMKMVKEAIYGNGHMGLNTKILLVTIAVAILGADSQLVAKLVKVMGLIK